MDLSLIKKKLADSQSKGQKREKVDYSKIFWKPTVGKSVVRILPSKFDKQNPFREVQLHYGFKPFPILALTNWGEKDPIDEFSKQLRKSSNKEDWELAKKVSPKTRYFAPVIVRGEEDKGARLWEFGKLNYEILLGIGADEDYGDFTDISSGFDMTVEGTEKMSFNKKTIECTIRPKPKTSVITDNATLLESLLSEQPDILGIHKKYSFDEIKDILNDWLNPEDEAEDAIVSESTDENTEVEQEVATTVAKTTKTKLSGKNSTSSKFEALFEKEEQEQA